MKPVKQRIINVDIDNNTVMVESAKGNRYNVDLNHYCGDIQIDDIAIVTRSLSGEWIMVDVINKYPYSDPLDVVNFPRDENNCLNVVEYWKYRAEFDKLRTDRERNEMNLFLIKLFREKYGYDALRYREEPKNTVTTLEAFS